MITRRETVAEARVQVEAARAWCECRTEEQGYLENSLSKEYYLRFLKIYERLLALPESISPEEWDLQVPDSHAGFRSMIRCHGCGESVEEAVRMSFCVGECETTHAVCNRCLLAAMMLIEP